MKEYVLVTGGSGGIGCALAQVFAKNGYNIILVARRENQLQKVAQELRNRFNIECHYIVQDLSVNCSAEKLYDEITNQGLIVDILINNAGFGTWGAFWTLDCKRTASELQLNMASLVTLSQLFLNDMISRKRGKIVNIASTAAFQPGPLMAVYYATKSFIVSFSTALARELEGSGVSVTTICPGPTQTEFQQHAGMANMHLLKKIFLMDAVKVAEVSYQGIMNEKTIVIPGMINSIVSFVVRFLPRRFVTSVVYMLHKRRG